MLQRPVGAAEFKVKAYKPSPPLLFYGAPPYYSMGYRTQRTRSIQQASSGSTTLYIAVAPVFLGPVDPVEPADPAAYLVDLASQHLVQIKIQYQ